MKKLLLSALIVVSLGGGVVFADSWWTSVGGQMPNLSGNYIYGLSAKQGYGDLESTLLTEKVNGNPINLNIGYVPQTDIGVIGLSYDLNNLPANFDYAWRGLVNVTISLGVDYDGSVNKWDLTIGGRLIQLKF